MTSFAKRSYLVSAIVHHALFVGAAIVAFFCCPAAYAVMDDFNDGVDDGWNRYNPIGTGSWILSGGTYRIQSAAAANPSATGPGRAGSIRTTESFSQFYLAVDLPAWDNTLDQIFGLIARVGTPGPATTRGYAFTYATRTGRATTGQLQILRIANEGGTDITPGINFTLQANQQYRLVFTGELGAFTGKLYSLANLTTPLVTMTASDAAYSAGGIGFFTYDNSPTGRGRADVSFDNFVGAELSPPLTIERDSFSQDMRLSWPSWATSHRLERASRLPAPYWEHVDSPVGEANGRSFTFDGGGLDASFYRLAIPRAPNSVASSTINLNDGDLSIVTDSANGYSATFFDGATETGTYSYTPSVDLATLVLTSGAGPVSTISLTFTSSSAGTYTSDAFGTGGFKVIRPTP